jgi:hypothetical protein
MLFMPTDLQRTTNIVALALSAAASIFQFVPGGQRTRERALLLRGLYTRIELAVAEYQVGALTRDELIAVLEDVQRTHTKEDVP